MENPEYEKWIRAFYEGNFLSRGWNTRKKELLSKISDHKKEVEDQLNQVGEIISREWAKENDVRKINNQDLMHWGDLMKKAADNSALELLDQIENIKKKVTDILD